MRATTALIIYANPKGIRADRSGDGAPRLLVPLQVLIEATIAEVTLNNQLQYGLQWFFNSGTAPSPSSTLTSGGGILGLPPASTMC